MLSKISGSARTIIRPRCSSFQFRVGGSGSIQQGCGLTCAPERRLGRAIARLASFALSVSFVGLLSACHNRSATIGAPRAFGRSSVKTEASSAVSYDSPNVPMEKRLDLIAQTADPEDLPFLNKQRAERLKVELEGVSDPRLLEMLLPKYATELVLAGSVEDGIKQLDRLEELLRRIDPAAWREKAHQVWLMKALAYMRLGEQENCLLNHTSESCLLPIQGSGIHVKQRGSKGALAALNRILTGSPNDLSARWLLNIAYMTLGEYPNKVPRKFLIPPEAFKSDYDVGRFRDIADGLGLDVNGLSGGVIVDDFDGDGNLDIVLSAIGLTDHMHYFHNNGDGTFTDQTVKAGLWGEIGGLNIIQTDYDNDGFPDILVLRGGWFATQGHHPMSLLHNNGNGTFTDVTEKAGLLHFKPTQTAVWLDYNNDGWLDLFVGNESKKDGENPCELFRNNGDGTFTEVAHEAGVDIVAFVKGVVSADYNNDGRPDLYLSVQGGQNILLRNDGPLGPDKSPKGAWKFTNVAAEAGVTEPVHSFSCFFFDYDNDGWPDLFVTGYMFNMADVGVVAADYLGLPNNGDYPRLYHNERNGHFRDVTKAMHLHKLLFTMGVNFGDLDNDGWLDFYAGTGTPTPEFVIPNRMFRNAEGKAFQDVTTSGGFGHLQKGHGIAFADLNNDGNQDIYEEMGGALSGDTAYSVLYENPGHKNHWITMKLDGVQTNRAAIGARVHVIANTPAGWRSIYRTVGSGGSFGAKPFRQEIGLGNATSIDRVEIYWPVTGKTQALRGLEMDRFYKIKEGDAAAIPWDLKRFDYAHGASHHHHLTSTSIPATASR